jgi:flagellar motor switch protein FliN/FliY
MSDGALSQDEIDALLAGVDSTGMGAPAAPTSSLPDGDRKALQEFLAGTVSAQSSNLSMMTGASVSLQAPQVEGVSRDTLLQKLPDMVVAIKADFSSGFSGEHCFLMSQETAQRIASLMNKEENIELDEMAMSVIGEVVSQLTGTQITALTDKTGNKNIASLPPEAAFQPKNMISLPSGDFMRATYQVDMGDGNTTPVWEIFGAGAARDISRALGGGKDSDSMMDLGSMGMGSMGMGGQQGGNAFPSMQGSFGGGQQQQQQQQQMPQNFGGMGGGGYGGQQMMGGGFGGQQMMGNQGGYGMGQPMMGQTPSNVQSIQFPNLVPQNAQTEHGNIGLIMDVYMEMTVELGRTKKLIKEILGMGEGTIIELDKLAGEPVDILVNHKLIAKGEVVVIDENFGVRVTEIVSPMERMSDMG